ncbi:hypothetical protein BV20DRAFT_961413 [Pilatotrama ljubarskyi]|nr:hypothetical protein BV20DRAFT_961413 [Pilatotrama ljubarskyi]
MLEVLDHHFGALSRTFQPHIQVISRLLLSFVLYQLATSCILAVAAQEVVNGQVHTQGLSIVDSPQPHSTLNAGSEADVSIDISSTTSATSGIDSLEVYLASADAQVNLTVSSGPQLLTEEPGSTVKHIHWSVPTCLKTGAYNLTVYELSHLDDASFFAITPVPVQIQNNGDVSDFCNATSNALQVQPQPSNPPPSGLLPDPGHEHSSDAPTSSTDSASSTGTTTANGTVSATSAQITWSVIAPSSGGGVITVTAGDGAITVNISDLPGTIVVEPSGGAPSGSTDSSSGFITVTRTVAPTATATLTQIESVPVTVTLEETFIVTSFAPGTTLEYTSTRTLVSTAEVQVTQVTSPQQAGLLPVNAGSFVSPPFAMLFLWTIFASAFMYVLLSF